MENPICTIKKSQREEIRIAFSQFKKGGKVYDMVSIRTFYDDGTGAGYPHGCLCRQVIVGEIPNGESARVAT